MAARNVPDPVAACKEAVERFADGAEPNDDVTILLLARGQA